jgi:hypothetical protein
VPEEQEPDPHGKRQESENGHLNNPERAPLTPHSAN